MRSNDCHPPPSVSQGPPSHLSSERDDVSFSRSAVSEAARSSSASIAASAADAPFSTNSASRIALRRQKTGEGRRKRCRHLGRRNSCFLVRHIKLFPRTLIRKIVRRSRYAMKSVVANVFSVPVSLRELQRSHHKICHQSSTYNVGK